MRRYRGLVRCGSCRGRGFHRSRCGWRRGRYCAWVRCRGRRERGCDRARCGRCRGHDLRVRADQHPGKVAECGSRSGDRELVLCGARQQRRTIRSNGHVIYLVALRRSRLSERRVEWGFQYGIYAWRVDTQKSQITGNPTGALAGAAIREMVLCASGPLYFSPGSSIKQNC